MLLLLWTPVAARSQGLFQGGVEAPLPERAGELVVEDFDSDGRPDAAAINAGAQGKDHVGVFVLLGDAVSVLGPPRSYPAGLSPVTMAAGDLNGDASLDLVVSNIGSGTLSVLLNQGKGTFSPLPERRVGIAPRALVLADFDRDGELDVATSDLNARAVSVHLGDGKGGFQDPLSIFVGDNPHTLVAGDFDGDGAQDLVVAQSEDMRLLRGLADGRFLGGRTIGPPGVRFLARGDLNGDAKPDLAAIGDDTHMIALTNAGGGGFDVKEGDYVRGVSADGDLHVFLSVSDFDADGRADITVVAALDLTGDSALSVFRAQGDGSFERRDPVPLDVPAAGSALADMDGDGILDEIATRQDAPAIVYYRGTAPGRLGVREAVPLSGSPRDIIRIDADHDGLADLLALGQDRFYRLRKDPVGGFEDPVSDVFPASAFERAIAADFDGDGRTDAGVTDFAGLKARIAFLGDGGAVARWRDRPLGVSAPGVIAVADFDLDGLPDLAVADQALQAVEVVLAPGSPERAESVLVPAGSGQTAIAAADVDRDGAMDLVAATRDGGLIAFGDGRRGFPRSIEMPALKGSPAVRAADLDVDGAVDVAAVLSPRIAVFGSAAAEGDSRRLDLDGEQGMALLEAIDVDSDGRLDLVTAARSALLVLRDALGGGFAPVDSYPTGLSPRAAVLADLDGDGAVDAATADFDTKTISLLHGRIAAGGDRLFRRGDADGNGRAELTDAVAILDALFRGTARLSCEDAADVNDDGALNITDAVHLLLYLFAGGPAPPPPGPGECGRDPTPDALPPCTSCQQ